MPATDLEQLASALEGSAELRYLTLGGERLSLLQRQRIERRDPSDDEWTHGLTAMRHVLRRETQAKIVIGGRVDKYKGVMPGIAEEVLLSLQARQPLFLLGGFGGCARDIAETLKLIEPSAFSRPAWKCRNDFQVFGESDLRNGLTSDENRTLATTAHIDQAIVLILRGLLAGTRDTSSD